MLEHEKAMADEARQLDRLGVAVLFRRTNVSSGLAFACASKTPITASHAVPSWVSRSFMRLL
jgi:hypothetical protein